MAALGSDEFPAFFTPSSGCKAPFRVESASQVAAMIHASSQLGLEGGMVLGECWELVRWWVSIGRDQAFWGCVWGKGGPEGGHCCLTDLPADFARRPSAVLRNDWAQVLPFWLLSESHLLLLPAQQAHRRVLFAVRCSLLMPAPCGCDPAHAHLQGCPSQPTRLQPAPRLSRPFSVPYKRRMPRGSRATTSRPSCCGASRS